MIAAANFVGLPLMFLSSILIPQRRCRAGCRASPRFNPVELGRARGAERRRLGRQRGEHAAIVPWLARRRCARLTSLFATWCFRAYQRSI